MVDPVLYVFVRTDLASMTPGRAVAQGSHASTMFALSANKVDKLFNEWRGDRGFGTVIVLGVADTTEMRRMYNIAFEHGLPASLVVDSTYSLRDGEYTHLIPVLTCGWAFCDREKAGYLFADLKLYK